MLVRFLTRSFHNGSIVEPGTEVSVADGTVLGQHMMLVDGENAHIADTQPFMGRFRADLAYYPDPEELRAQMTEEARIRAEATRAREADEEAQRVAASTGDQPQQVSEPTDQGGDAADG